MKKILLLLLFITASPLLLANSDSKVMPGNEVGVFHYIKATNPLNVLAATDKFMASDCGVRWKKESGANVVLMQLDGSGMSHFFYVGFADYEKMEAGNKIAGSCAENFEFLQTIGANSHQDLYYSRIGELSLQRGDWTTDSIFYKYDLYVQPAKRADYAKEWTKMTNSIGGSGSSGLVTHMTGNGRVSHFAFIGASSLPELASESSSALSSMPFAKFAKAVGDYRTVQNVMLVTPVKGW